MRSAEEILATLDERGELENLPFMPEMLAFCGQRLTVHKVAHKACDTISRSGMRRMTNAVHLTGSRCDGSAHGGCQTACSLYWKEQWLRRVDPGSRRPRPLRQRSAARYPFSRSTHARSRGLTAKCGIPARPPSYCALLRHACPSATSASTSRT